MYRIPTTKIWVIFLGPEDVKEWIPRDRARLSRKTKEKGESDDSPLAIASAVGKTTLFTTTTEIEEKRTSECQMFIDP